MLQEVGQAAAERSYIVGFPFFFFLRGERSDIVDRVFHIKLKEFMRNIREREYLEKTLASNILLT